MITYYILFVVAILKCTETNGGLVDFFDFDDMYYQVMTNKNYDFQTSDKDECNNEKIDDENGGVCLSKWDCNRQGGSPGPGDCGHFKRCCIVKKKCGESTNAKISYFEYSKNDEDNDCMYTVKLQESVCQIRVDFITFDLEDVKPPATDCDNEYLEIKDNSDDQLSRLCGSNQQHIYLHVHGKKEVTFRTQLGSSSSKKIKFKVTQLKCFNSQGHKSKPHKDFKWLAPIGCRQYFTDRSGEIKSLGYRDSSTTGNFNGKYAICFRRRPDDCYVKLKITDLPMKQNGVNEPTCNNYLYIPGLKLLPTQTDDITAKTCVFKVGEAEMRSPGLFYLYFSSIDAKALYFKLNYDIMRCG